MTDDQTRVPLDELRSRARRLQGHLRDAGLGGALFVQNVDRYYFSGTMQGGFVVVPADGDPLVLVRRDPDRAAAESPLPVEPLASARDLAGRIRVAFGEIPAPLGLELDVLPAAQVARFERMLPGATFGDVSRALALTRAVKSPWEIDRIRRAARTVADAVARIPDLLEPGMTELELAARVECELRLRGHGGLIRMRGFNQEIFYGHVITGPASAEPSFLDAPTGGAGLGPALAQGPGSQPIAPGVPVSVDLVGNHQGYLSDQTRPLCLGEPEAPFGRAFEAAVAIERAVVDAARPGVSAGDLYRVAVDAAADTAFGDRFMGAAQKVSFVGHGIGLEVDEYPFLARGFDLPLAEGMVFALEPKFVFPARGVVGIEDTYRVTADGVERLTPSPQEMVIVPGR